MNPINFIEKDWGGVLTVLSNPNLHLYAAEKDDKFVGWISIVYIPKLGQWKHFGHLYVDGVRLYVSMNNPSAKGLYEKFGFKVCDEAYFMEKK